MSDARAPGTWIGYAPLADLEAAQVFAAWMVMVGRKPVPDICWAIERRDVPGLIGLCQLKGWDPVERTAQVGYEIARPHQRHGFMREALEALPRGCFQGFGLRHLDAHVHADNAASLALLRHAGFVLQGELPGGKPAAERRMRCRSGAAARRLFPVVGMAGVHGPRTVELLDQQHPHHRMRQREVREADALVRGLAEGRVEPVRTADDQRHVVAAQLPVLRRAARALVVSEVPRSSSATTRVPRGMAASMRSRSAA